MKEKWVSISGGKDSTAMFDIIIKNQIKVTGFVCCLIRDGEEPDMIKHIFRLKEIAECNKYEFVILENRNKFEDFMYEVVTSKKSNHYGKIRGFPLTIFPCWISRDWKIKLLNRFKKQREVISGDKIITCLGFAIDEKNKDRQKAIQKYKDGKEEDFCYPLVDFDLTEEDCRQYIKDNNVYCQTHFDYNRSGCWFCPKASIKNRIKAIKKNPNRIQKIREWTKKTGREIYSDITLKEIELKLNKSGATKREVSELK